MYAAYRMHRILADPIRHAAGMSVAAATALPRPVRDTLPIRALSGAGQLVAESRLTHVRPQFDIDRVLVGERQAEVHQRPVDGTAFATLRRFGVDTGFERPAVLLVAPLSGHFATILTPTVRALLRDHDVYITDWHNARDVPVRHGRFGLDEYVDHLVRFQRVLGPGTHMFAVCQPSVAALMATAALAAADDPAQPRTLTLMAGPIDTRINQTKVNAAAHRPLEWFERRCITTVPRGYPGTGRRVYPGFLQLSGFMALNLRRHLGSYGRMYRDLVWGDTAAAVVTQNFYREYYAVLDMPAEFYLDTIQRVFKEHHLPRGVMRYRGELVPLDAVRRTAVLTVEAALDDMCAPGQTAAAHTLLPNVPDVMRKRHIQPGVGHYGIFAGRRWEEEVYPVVRDFMAEHSAASAAVPSV